MGEENDELDVVVTLGEEELTVGVGSGADGYGGEGEGDEGAGTLIDDGDGMGNEEGDDDLDVATHLDGVGMADPTDEVEGDHLYELAPAGDGIDVSDRSCMEGRGFIIVFDVIVIFGVTIIVGRDGGHRHRGRRWPRAMKGWHHGEGRMGLLLIGEDGKDAGEWGVAAVMIPPERGGDG